MIHGHFSWKLLHFMYFRNKYNKPMKFWFLWGYIYLFLILCRFNEKSYNRQHKSGNSSEGDVKIKICKYCCCTWAKWNAHVSVHYGPLPLFLSQILRSRSPECHLPPLLGIFRVGQGIRRTSLLGRCGPTWHWCLLAQKIVSVELWEIVCVLWLGLSGG